MSPARSLSATAATPPTRRTSSTASPATARALFRAAARPTLSIAAPLLLGPSRDLIVFIKPYISYGISRSMGGVTSKGSLAMGAAQSRFGGLLQRGAAGGLNGHRLGFRSLHSECVLDSLALEGALPDWLSGSLYRVGPAKFEVGGRAVNHWFDGFSMLHRFAFGGGSVSYANRFLASRAYRAAAERGRISYSEFATDPCRSLFGRLAAVFRSPHLRQRERQPDPARRWFVAMTETPMPVELRPPDAGGGGRRLEVAREAHHRPPPPRPGAPAASQLRGQIRGPAQRLPAFSRPSSAALLRDRSCPSPAAPAYMHSFGLSER